MNTSTGEIRRLAPGELPGPNEILVSEERARLAEQINEIRCEESNRGVDAINASVRRKMAIASAFSRGERRAMDRKRNGGLSNFVAGLR